MEKINISDILRNCPTGMELYCTMYQDVYFDYVDELNIIHCYIQHETHKTSITFNQFGTPNSDIKSRCVIFPKGKFTWAGFNRPFENGDIIYNKEINAIAIFYKQTDTSTISHCFLNIFKELKLYHYHAKDLSDWKFATEEEKKKLFQAIKDNGYKWNSKDKTLKKIVEPIFKVGDRIRTKKGAHVPLSNILITEVNECSYNGVIGSTTNTAHINFKYQDQYELVPVKFDISNLKPFDWVLVRSDNKHKWSIQFFERLNNVLKDAFVCMGGVRYHQCIPYEGNEHLLNTTNEPDNFYITWKE